MKKRLVSIDYLKAICVILVILTHGSNINTAMLDKTGLFYLLVVNKCVPVFMFLSGYVYTLGKEKFLRQEYSLRVLIPKALRLTIPMLTAFIIYVALNVASGREFDVLKSFFLSDFGPGSYYYPVMIQFVLFVPAMYLLVKKLGAWGVGVIGILNFGYEIISVVSEIDISYYRIIFLRYLLIVAFGLYFGINRDKKLNWVLISAMATVGLMYILAPYFGYRYILFTIDPWNRSNMMSAFYVAAVIGVIMKLFGKAEEDGALSKIVSKVGQASYHIMYTQMIYFVCRPGFDKVFDLKTLPLFVQYFVDIVVPVTAGIVFCISDNKIFGKFYKVNRKK